MTSREAIQQFPNALRFLREKNASVVIIAGTDKFLIARHSGLKEIRSYDEMCEMESLLRPSNTNKLKEVTNETV